MELHRQNGYTLVNLVNLVAQTEEQHVCGCGASYRTRNRSRQEASQRHKQWVNSNAFLWCAEKTDLASGRPVHTHPIASSSPSSYHPPFLHNVLLRCLVDAHFPHPHRALGALHLRLCKPFWLMDHSTVACIVYESHRAANSCLYQWQFTNMCISEPVLHIHGTVPIWSRTQ
jgi:hypothetical protein